MNLTSNIHAEGASSDTSKETTPTYNLVNCLLKLGRQRLLIGTDKGLYCLTPSSKEGKFESIEIFNVAVKGIYKQTDSILMILTEKGKMTLYCPSNTIPFHWQIINQKDTILLNEIENTSCKSHYMVFESKLKFINEEELTVDDTSFFSEAMFKEISNKIKILGGFEGLSSLEQLESKNPSELIYFRYLYNQHLLAIFSRHGISYYFNPDGSNFGQTQEDGFYAMHFLNTDGGPKPVKYLRFAQE